MEEVKLSESFVDLFLHHIVLWLPKVAVAKYYVVTTNIHMCMTVHFYKQ